MVAPCATIFVCHFVTTNGSGEICFFSWDIGRISEPQLPLLILRNDVAKDEVPANLFAGV